MKYGAVRKSFQRFFNKLTFKFTPSLQLKTIAKERDEGNRTMYCSRIAEFHREQLLFIDKSEKFWFNYK